MMLDRMEGNAELKSSVQLMLAARRLTHSVLLVGEEGLGAGFAARCIAADYLYPAGGAPAEALLRGECCRAVGKPGDRDSGHVETGIVREAISVAGMGAGGKYLVSQVKAMRSEIFNTSLSAEGRAVLLYHVEKMNEESANALLKVMEEPPEGVLFLAGAVRPLLRRTGGGQKDGRAVQRTVRRAHWYGACRRTGRSPHRAGGKGPAAGKGRCRP